MPNIRPFSPADKSALTSLFEEMQRHYCVPCPPSSVIEDHLAGLPAGVEIMVAETDRGIIGFAAFSAIYPGPGLRSGLFMKELFVTAGSRGQGVGKALISVSCSRGGRARAQPRRLDRRPDRCWIAGLLFRSGGAGAARKGFLPPHGRCARSAGVAGLLIFQRASRSAEGDRSLPVLPEADSRGVLALPL